MSLTFDDGPDAETTPLILDTLRRYNIPASFFLPGNKVANASATLKESVHRMLEEGHFVGSQSHSDMSKLRVQGLVSLVPLKDPNTAIEIQQEVEDTEMAMKDIVGFRPFLIRAPVGSLSDRAREYLGAKGKANGLLCNGLTYIL